MKTTKQYANHIANSKIRQAHYSMAKMQVVYSILLDPTLCHREKIEYLTSVAKIYSDRKRYHDACVNRAIDPFDDTNSFVAHHRAQSEKAGGACLGVLAHLNRALNANVKLIDLL